jgi:ubiquinone biosynthesis monooxygenase Coq7
MDGRSAREGASQSGQPPHRKLAAIAPEHFRRCKDLGRKRRGDVVWQQRETVGLDAGLAPRAYPRKTHPRDSDRVSEMDLDAWIESADQALRTLTGGAHAARSAPQAAEGEMSRSERNLSGALLRVDHVGEVCAQALYQAQSYTARSPQLRAQMRQAASEEVDHLAWTERRLRELGARTSLLNPLWYAGAFGIGLLAGAAGDRWSLGFVVETERQVEEHLAGHLDQLPAADARSRAIVEQMKIDEGAHADTAQRHGAAALPAPIRLAMRLAARVMTRTAHHI